jgi:hypothetical protein
MKQTTEQPKKRGNPLLAEYARRAGTQWKPGQSGNPKGRPSVLSEKAVSDGLRAFYNGKPEEFKKFLLSAHRRATGKRANAKFWELISEHLQGKIAQQIDVRGEITHSVTDLDRQRALEAIESIRAFESESESPLIGELCEEVEGKPK